MNLPISPYAWAGDTLYIGGIAPLEKGEVLFPGDLKKQFLLVMDKLRSILTENNMDLNSLVMVNVFLADMRMFDSFNEYYTQEMAQPWPPRKLVEAKMSRKEVTIEMAAIAYREKEKTNENY